MAALTLKYARVCSKLRFPCSLVLSHRSSTFFESQINFSKKRAIYHVNHFVLDGGNLVKSVEVSQDLYQVYS